jgi:hypothetical protein
LLPQQAGLPQFDAFGRPIYWQPLAGAGPAIPNPIVRSAPGIGFDQFGRPVQPTPYFPPLTSRPAQFIGGPFDQSPFVNFIEGMKNDDPYSRCPFRRQTARDPVHHYSGSILPKPHGG